MTTVLIAAFTIAVVVGTLIVAACLRMAGLDSQDEDARLLRELRAAFEAEREDRRDAA